MWVALAMIVLLVVFSIIGAFLGAACAKAVFNSLPLDVYWFFFIMVLAGGMMMFRRLVRVPAILLIHAGCVLILGGAMWGSPAGHEVQSHLFGIEKIPDGRMVIHEGEQEKRVFVSEQEVRELPFYVRLKSFRMEYYEPSRLIVEGRDGTLRQMPVKTGSSLELGASKVRVTILKQYENFKIRIDGDKREAYDDTGAGLNAALEVRLDYPDGRSVTRYVFEKFPGHGHANNEYVFAYRRQIRDYISELEIVQNGEVSAAKAIEVNHPLGFGGYDFYQDSYGSEQGIYTVLRVTSNSGVRAVYAGYAMLCAGLFWHLWLKDVTAGVLKFRKA